MQKPKIYKTRKRLRRSCGQLYANLNNSKYLRSVIYINEDGKLAKDLGIESRDMIEVTIRKVE